jgi:hypothetical protein
MFLSTLGRVIWVPIAFLISAMISIGVLVTLGQEQIVRALHQSRSEEDAIAALFTLASEAFLLTSGLTVLPALLLVIVGEVARIRSALYYVIGAGVALAAMPLVLRMGQSEPGGFTSAVALQVFATAGFAGGFVYWLIAGRRA